MASTPLHQNRGFRRLWGGQAISNFGDWFTYVAVGVLALEQGEGLMAVAVVLLGHSLPRALLGPWAGRVIDRHDRRRILVIVSLLRALTVLAMMWAASRGALAVVQALVFVRIGLSAFIDPAGLALLPQLVAREQIVAANKVLSATWSIIFGIGVAAGGLATAWGGPLLSLAVDALTFVISAGVFASLPRPVGEEPAEIEASSSADRRGGLQLAWTQPELLRAALAKLPVSLATGGGWVLLHDLGERWEPLHGLGGAALGLGLLHAARALGTGIGPLLLLGRLRESVLGVRISVVLSFLAVAAFALAQHPTFVLISACVWGIGAGMNWVGASTRMQLLAANEELGRVASLDVVALSLAQSCGGLLGALVADHYDDAHLAAWVGVGLGALGWLLVGALVHLAHLRAQRATMGS